MEKREAHKDHQVAWHVAMGPSQRRRLGRDELERLMEECKSSVRAKVEHVFILCEADVWLWQGALPQLGEERESAGPAAWIYQSAAGRILYGVMFTG